jgi:hypothetical protein
VLKTSCGSWIWFSYSSGYVDNSFHW